MKKKIINFQMSLIDSENTATDSNGFFVPEQDPGYDEDESFLTQLIKTRWSNKCVFSRIFDRKIR